MAGWIRFVEIIDRIDEPRAQELRPDAIGCGAGQNKGCAAAVIQSASSCPRAPIFSVAALAPGISPSRKWAETRFPSVQDGQFGNLRSL